MCNFFFTWRISTQEVEAPVPLVTLPPRPFVVLATPSVTTVPPTVQMEPVLAALVGIC